MEKSLKSYILVLFLAIALVSSSFIVIAIDYPDVKTGDPNDRSWTHVAPEGNESYISGDKVLISPSPDIDNYTDDVEDEVILYYTGDTSSSNWILAFSIGRTSYYAWRLQEPGTYIGRTDFDATILWITPDGKLLGPSKYDAGYTKVEITLTENGNNNNSNNSNDTCFLPGTKVLMDDYSVKNIEQIQANDTVKSINLSTGEIESDRVTKVESHTPQEMKNGYLVVEIDNNATVKVTPDHPITVTEDSYSEFKNSSEDNDKIFNDGIEFSYRRAGDLEVGDRIFNHTVTAITEYPEAHNWSYNLVLKDNLNFVVAKESSNSPDVSGGESNDILDGWNGLKNQTAQVNPGYQPLIAPGVKGNSAAGYLYFRGTNSAYALPLLQISQE